MLGQNLSVDEIKDIVIQFHKKKNYIIFKAFPLITNDPTVLFMNATITPFKQWFTNHSINPQNYALIQRCIRMGGASEFDVIGNCPYYFSSFEMFGSGTFTSNTDDAVIYLLELLDNLRIKKECLYFTIPDSDLFLASLIKIGIQENRIFPISNNDIFWQEWRFGNPGPMGNGLSIIFSRSIKEIKHVKQLSENPEEFIEMLNLIYVHSYVLSNGKIQLAANPGFDLGVGIERLAAISQDCNSYQIDTIKPLVQIVSGFLPSKFSQSNEAIVRICTDYLRTICLLSEEGLKPSNKGHGYVLRKLIRRFLECIWCCFGNTVNTKYLIENFIDVFVLSEHIEISSITVNVNIEREAQALKDILLKAKEIYRKNPNLSLSEAYDTYGLSHSLFKLIM